MGNDEHGAAYPEPPRYHCPTCGSSDRDRFIRCYHPMCPDGRDQRRFDRLRETYDEPTYKPSAAWRVTAKIINVLVAVMLAVALVDWIFRATR